jgi:hypothetical protein
MYTKLSHSGAKIAAPDCSLVGLFTWFVPFLFQISVSACAAEDEGSPVYCHRRRRDEFREADVVTKHGDVDEMITRRRKMTGLMMNPSSRPFPNRDL